MFGIFPPNCLESSCHVAVVLCIRCSPCVCVCVSVCVMLNKILWFNSTALNQIRANIYRHVRRAKCMSANEVSRAVMGAASVHHPDTLVAY